MTRSPHSACALILVACAIGALSLGGCRHRTKDPRADLQARRTSGPDGNRHRLTGRASWYGERFQGRKTACGDRFDMRGFTAAHKTLPFHTIVRVWDPATFKSVVVRINDRGPYKKGRVIDLSRAAAQDLGMLSRGTIPVSIDILAWGDGSRCEG